MILYHVITIYHLLCFAEHRLLYHPNEEAVLLMPSVLRDKLADAAEAEAIFSRVLEAPLHVLPDNSSDEVRKGSLKLFAAMEKQTGISFAGAEHIYVAGAQYPFGIYLALRGIPFVMLEESAGILSRLPVLLGIDRRLCAPRSALAESLGLYSGENPLVSEILANVGAQQHLVCDKLKPFDAVEAFHAMAQPDRARLLSCFVPKGIPPLPENTTLLLTQHFTHLMAMTFEQNILLYQMAADYFFSDENLAFKPHPSDLMYYSELFPGCTVIHQRFPSELLPMVYGSRVRKIATISSTAIENLAAYYPASFALDNRYDREFPLTHRYAAALDAMRFIAQAPVDVAGGNELLALRLMEASAAPAEMDVAERAPQPDHWLLVGDLETGEELAQWMAAGRVRRAVFLNTQEHYCFCRTHEKEAHIPLIPVALGKTRAREEDFYASKDTETLYFYVADTAERARLRAWTYRRCLPRTGLTVERLCLTAQEERVCMLKAEIHALERAILALPVNQLSGA